MNLRPFLFFLFLLLAPGAFAQVAPATGLLDREVCGSLGVSEDLSDIDESSCRPFSNFNEIDPQGRVVWVRGRFPIQEGYPGAAPLGFFTGALASREIWWNGQRIGAVGKPAATAADEQPGDLDATTWIPPELIRIGDNTVAIRYSTFGLDMRVRSPVHYAYAGRMLRGREMLAAYGPTLAVTGALVAAALFFGFSYFSDRRSTGPLFIALMCLFAVGQLWLESLRGFMTFPYPVQIWRLIGIAILAFGFSLSLTAYVAGRFVPKRWRMHVAVAALLAVVMMPFMPGFDGMTLGLIIAPTAVSLAAAGQGIVARRPGAILTALALSVFFAMQFIFAQGFLDTTLYLAVGLLALFLFIDQAFELRRSRKAAEEASRKASLLELELLRRRIAPHFLMNTLNALTEWVESDPKTGVKMIEALAGEFRLLSQIADRTLIPLADEIALCRRHLEVMSYRTDRAFTLRADKVDEAIEIPPGVLHTLIENAFTHGRFADGTEFVLTQEREGDQLRLALLAPEAEAPAPARDEGGQGLSYVRARLEAAFGAAASFASRATPQGWLSEIRLPGQGLEPA
jgi:hypothetical protein